MHSGNVFECSGSLNVLHAWRVASPWRGRAEGLCSATRGQSKPLTLVLSPSQGDAASTARTNSTLAQHTHLFSNGKITFQSFFMLMTIQPFFFASS